MAIISIGCSIFGDKIDIQGKEDANIINEFGYSKRIESDE